MKWRNFLLSVLAVVTVVTLAACGNESGATGEESEETDASDQTLIVYTNSASDGRGDWLEEQASNEGFDLEIVEAGGGELYNRLLAEKGNPLADVAFGMTEMDWNPLKDEGVLTPYEPSWMGELPEGASDADNMFHPIVEQRILLLYNQDVYDETTAPQDYTDLWENEAFHGKYHVPGSLGGATNRTAMNGIINRYLDEDGDLGVSDEGWENVESFLANGYMTSEGEDVYANLADGTVPIAYYYSSGITGIEEKFSFEAGIVAPEVGVPTITEQVGIINHGDNHDYTLVEEFVDWFGSSDVQGAWANEFGSLPVNTVAIEQSSERMQEITEMTTVQDLDYSIISNLIDDWVEKIELQIY